MKFATAKSTKVLTQGEVLAKYVGFVARLHDFWGLGGRTDGERLDAVSAELSRKVKSEAKL